MKNNNNIARRVAIPAFAAVAMAVAAPDAAFAQMTEKAATVAPAMKSVEFSVVDAASGSPVSGARVSVVGSPLTALTADNGAITLALPAADVLVTVEAPGYKPVEVGVRGRSSVSVVLSAEVFESPLIGQTTADQNVSDLMGNLFAVSRSGMPGAGYAVFVDGLHSINTSSQPLYVVDGQIWQPDENQISVINGFNRNPLALIDPKDIESVKVLKNGAAIYGSKGGNGVILITTRRARNEATQIEAFANIGSRQRVKSIPVMDAGDYRRYASDIVAGMFPNSSSVDRFNFLNDDPSSYSWPGSHANTDWLDRIGRNALLMSYGINVRGGDDRALYAFSLGYTKNDAPVKETSFDRINIRFNSDINLWAGLKLRFDVAFAQSTTNMFSDGIDEIASPYYMSLIKSPLYSTNIYSASGILTQKLSDVDELGVGNPLSILDLAQGESRNYRFNLIAAPSYTINNHFRIAGNVAYIFDKDKENTFLPDYGVADVALVNNTGETYAIVRQDVRNLMNRRTTFSSDVNLQYVAFNDYANMLKFTGGWRYSNDTWVLSYGQGYNTGSDYVNDLNATQRDLFISDGYHLEWRNMAWYLTGDYSWHNRYELSAAVAMESSSRFGKNAPGAAHIAGTSWGFFPTVNAAWVISNEDFMAGAPKVNLLKLGLGYEMTGNDNLPVNATSTYFASAPFLGNLAGYTLANIGNDRLKWETTSTARATINAAFFDNRLAFTLEGYLSETRDLLMYRQLNDVAGIENYWTNGGRLRNRGVNFAVTGRAVNTRDWKLDLGAAIGMYRNRVTALDNGDFFTDINGAQVMTSVGNPVGVFYGYRTDGVFSTSAEAAAADLAIVSNNGSKVKFEAGDMHFVDRNGNHLIDEADRFVIGNPNPDFYGNFSFNLTWRNFSLNSIFTYSVGNDVYNALRASLESGSGIFNQSTAMNARWRANGQLTEMPRATYGDPMGNARFSDRWIEDGSYLKWKSLSFSYDLPLRSTFIQGLTFTFSMSNILTLTKYLGSDPEFYSGTSPLSLGIDNGLIPLSREFNFGVKINL